MNYQVQSGDSPAIIARKFGVPFFALIQANPHKIPAVVAGVRTWREIVPGEMVFIPPGPAGTALLDNVVPYGVGDTASDAASQLAAVDPCNSDNVELVCQFQASHGISPDGKYGHSTAQALKALVPTAPGACQHQAWWAPHGQSSCGALQQPALMATAALAALNADPNYCQSVRRVGSPVNRAIHNFKTAWNAANPGQPVPVGTSNYEQSVADALQSLTAGTPPAGCTGSPMPWGGLQPGPVPTQGPPLTQPVIPGIPGVPPPAPPPLPGPAPSPVAASAAAQALAAVNPCDPGSAPLVCAFQTAMGMAPDGKYGDVVASALRAQVSNAPSACTPRPSWWAPHGQGNCGSAYTCPPGTVMSQTTGECVPGGLILPEKKGGISTGALVAGGIGAAALVGIVAIAATGKKAVVTRYKTRKSGKATHRKASKKKR